MTPSTATPELLLSTARAYRPLPTPDGLVFASDLTGFAQSFRCPSPQAWPVRLAAIQERLLPVALTDLGLLLRHDRGGNETWQLSLLGEGGLRAVTADENAIHQSLNLSPDRRRVGLAYNPGGRRDFTIGVLDLASGGIEDWLDEGGMWEFLDWTPDGQAAIAVHVLRPTANEAYLVRPGQKPRRILEGAGRVESVLHAGGRAFAVTDLDQDFLTLVELDAGLEPKAKLVDEPHDVRAAVPDSSGERLAVAVNEGAYDSLRILDLDGGEIHRADLPRGGVYSDNTSEPAQHLAWSHDGRSLFVAWEGPTRPAEIYELTSDGRPPVRWTAASGEPLAGLVEPEETEYTSFDGLRVPALHFKTGQEGPRPTVVFFHGGPEGQFRASFNPQVASLTAAGFDVFAPNVRGSTGYGRAYYSLDDREKRWDSVRDGCEAARHLKREGLAGRTAAMGGSYGGFMTLAVLVEDPDLWDAGVDTVGIASWKSFFANTSGWRRALRAAEYGDPDREPDATFLEEFSPLNKADRIRAALLVIHGRNDVRVPLVEAEQIAQAVPDAELMIFDDEGHGITRHGNRVKAYGRAVEFLRKRFS